MADQHIDGTLDRAVTISSPEILSRMPPSILYMGEVPGTAPIENGFAPIFVSDNIRGILGYEPTEILGNDRWWQNHLHPDDRPHVLSRLQTLLARGRLCHEYRFRHREGHYVWIQDTFKVVPDDAGRPYEIVGSWADITHRKQVEQALGEVEMGRPGCVSFHPGSHPGYQRL